LLWRLIAVSYVIGCSRMEQACIFGLSMKQELNCIDFVPTVNLSVLSLNKIFELEYCK